jgi:hypothetical protein
MAGWRGSETIWFIFRGVLFFFSSFLPRYNINVNARELMRLRAWNAIKLSSHESDYGNNNSDARNIEGPIG